MRSIKPEMPNKTRISNALDILASNMGMSADSKMDPNETRIANALASIAANLEGKSSKVQSLTDTGLACGTVIEAVGIPVYVDDVTEYADFGITETGWYVFARISAPGGMRVTGDTDIEGAAGCVASAGADHIDVAVLFDVAAVSQTVVIDWGGYTESFVFKATDLAVRNLDYRVTFYVYDVDEFATWEYTFATDATFDATKFYWVQQEDGTYAAATVTAGEAIPAYYTSDDGTTYTQVAGTFEAGVTYYTKSEDTYTEATVTVGDPIPAYYVHSKVTFEGMTRNITYRCRTIIDCPVVFNLPVIEDETHGAWFEIRFQHSGSFSSTLNVPEGVKVATEHTQPEAEGINVVDLHYTVINDLKIWRFLNTHSSIPTT